MRGKLKLEFEAEKYGIPNSEEIKEIVKYMEKREMYLTFVSYTIEE